MLEASAPSFPGRIGRGVTIAVVDSGVHPDHPHIAAGQLLDGVAVSSDGTLSRGEGATLDRLGHGTAVAAAIQEKAPAALCLPVRVFHDSLRTAARTLVTAIDWCVDARVDIVNLSLGTVNPDHRPALAAAVDRAAAAGVLVVAARDADGVPCYPGSLPDALGVRLDWDCPRDCYEVLSKENGPDGEGLVFAASGHPRPIPGVPQRRNLYGVSFAVANMTGFAAQASEALDMNVFGRERTAGLHALLQRRISVAAV